MFTLGSKGDSIGLGGDGEPEGMVGVPFTVAARQSVSTSAPVKFFQTAPSAVGRQDVPDPAQSGDVPDPGGSFAGEVVPFESVAPYHGDRPSQPGDGSAGKGHGGYVLGSGRPD